MSAKREDVLELSKEAIEEQRERTLDTLKGLIVEIDNLLKNLVKSDRLEKVSTISASINALWYMLNDSKKWFGNYQLVNLISDKDLDVAVKGICMATKMALATHTILIGKYYLTSERQFVTANQGVLNVESKGDDKQIGKNKRAYIS